MGFPQHLDLKGAYDPNELRAKNTAGRGQTQTGLDWHYDSTRISYSSGAAASNRRPKEPPVEKKAAKAKQIEKAAKEKIKGTQAKAKKKAAQAKQIKKAAKAKEKKTKATQAKAKK